MWPATVSCLAVALALAACGEGEVYTLYRNSPIAAGARIHWATFDAKESPGYNRGNCELAAQLLNRQAPQGVRWWCEPGRARNVS
jgi:hypothetical protein